MAPSTSPATSRPSLFGCGPWSCLRATKTGPCQSSGPPRCTSTPRSTKTLRTGPLTDSRSTRWKRCSRRAPTGASRAVFPRTASTTETTCAPTSQNSTCWLSTVMEYARKPSTWTCEATTARAAQALGGNKTGIGFSITTVPSTAVSLEVPAVLYHRKTTLGITGQQTQASVAPAPITPRQTTGLDDAWLDFHDRHRRTVWAEVIKTPTSRFELPLSVFPCPPTNAPRQTTSNLISRFLPLPRPC